jgi:hypothetical protein
VLKAARPRESRRARLIIAAAAAWMAACGTAPGPPITVTGGTLTVENQTTAEWRHVEVWVNDHYRVTKSAMPAGERFAIPLTAFVAGFGQRFDPARQVVQGVEVTASTKDGTPVKLVLGRGRRR